jgi:hypothetical protein
MPFGLCRFFSGDGVITELGSARTSNSTPWSQPSTSPIKSIREAGQLITIELLFLIYLLLLLLVIMVDPTTFNKSQLEAYA